MITKYLNTEDGEMVVSDIGEWASYLEAVEIERQKEMLEKALREIVSISPHCGDAMQSTAWDALEKLALHSSDWNRY
jgi:hypothetical protein